MAYLQLSFFFFFTSFLLATVSTFSQIPTHTYIPFSTCFRSHLLLEALRASPSWWNHFSPPHLWKQLVPCHITLVNIVLGLVKSVLGIVLSLPQIRIPRSAQRYQNSCVDHFPTSSWKVGSSQIPGWRVEESCSLALALQVPGRFPSSQYVAFGSKTSCRPA